MNYPRLMTSEDDSMHFFGLLYLELGGIFAQLERVRAGQAHNMAPLERDYYSWVFEDEAPLARVFETSRENGIAHFENVSLESDFHGRAGP